VATVPVLVPNFSGRGEQPIPEFTSARYTVLIHCVGGGPLKVVDASAKAKPYVSVCDGRGNTIQDTLDSPEVRHLRIVADPGSDWEARVEAR